MRNGLKRRLRDGETVCAAWLETGSPELAEILVRCGWDTVVIDCEHGAAGLEDGLNLVRAVEAAGGDAVVRVPDGADATIKRALDRGARSLIVPMVNTPAMAAQVAAACRYPPVGTRGYAASIVRASGFGAWADYGAEANDEVFLAAQIEHRDVLPHVAAIAGIPGIDMGFVGPWDLAGSMGRFEDPGHADVARAIAGVEADAASAGLPLGTIVGARGFGALRDDGYRLIVGPSDVGLLVQGARAAAAERDSALG